MGLLNNMLSNNVLGSNLTNIKNETFSTQLSQPNIPLTSPDAFRYFGNRSQINDLTYGAITKIANTVALCKPILYKHGDIVNDNLYKNFINRINPYQNYYEFITQMIIYKIIEGNAIAVIFKSPTGDFESIVPIFNSNVELILDNNRELWYHLMNEDIMIHSKNIIHLKYMDPAYPLTIEGSSPLNYFNSLNILDISLIERTKVRVSDKIGKFKVSYDKTLKEEDKKTIIKGIINFSNSYTNSPIFEDGGLKIERNFDSFNLNDTTIVSNYIKSRLSHLLGIPLELMGNDSTESKLDDKYAYFVNTTIATALLDIETQVNDKVLSIYNSETEGYRFEFDPETIIKPDAATKAKILQDGMRGAALSADDYRAAYKLPRLGGELGKYYRAQDMIEVGSENGKLNTSVKDG